MIKSTFQQNGALVSYYLQGLSDPTIVLLHGNSLSSQSFQAQFHDPNLRNFRLLAIDFPGHGESAVATEPTLEYNLMHFKDLVTNIIQDIGLQSFIFAGHSLGGHVAMECLPFVHGCRGLFLWGAPPVTLPLNIGEVFKRSPYAELLFKGRLSREEVNNLATLLSYEPHLEVIAELILRTDPTFRDILPLSFGNGKVSDEYNLLQKSNLPVAILHGEYDALISLDYLQKLKLSRLWQSRIIIMMQAYHIPQMERPREFNQLLKEFIEDCI